MAVLRDPSGFFAFFHFPSVCVLRDVLQRIPEDILKEKCAEALGLAEYNPAVLAAKVTVITIPDDGILVFTFKDGTERTLNWENRSRRESWTDEMKQAARVRTVGGADNG
jgi:hypothetical protein